MRVANLPRIVVLRLGHRIVRDKRLTTHVGLAARAFGADGMVVSGEEDQGVLRSLSSISEKWGGQFSVGFEPDWRGVVSAWRNDGGCVVHLTMYGLPLPSLLERLREEHTRRDMLVLVGGAKVESSVYTMADYNVSVTNQPHSEVSALAVFLDRLLGTTEMERGMENAKLRIVPQQRGKKIVRSRHNT